MPTKTLRSWTATEETTSALDREFRRLQALRGLMLKQYYDNPVAFAHDCIVWPEGQGPTPYQEEIWSMLVDHKRVAVRSCHGAGKSTGHAIAILWFALTRDAAGVDWKCPTTAGGWHQLEQYLWPEVHKWANRLRWTRLGRDPFRMGRELLRLNLQLDWGRAFAVASNIPARIEGAHAESLLFIFDEAKIIPVGTFDAAEGAFSGAKGTEALAYCSSTPGEPQGRFYDIHQLDKEGRHKVKGLESWAVRHVRITEVIDAGRTSVEWVQEHAALWGEGSALYHNRVLGEFWATTEDTVIPLPWIEMAVQRWKDHLWASKLAKNHPTYRGFVPWDRAGIDVAASGADKTVIAIVAGERVEELHTFPFADTTDTVANARDILEANPGMVVAVDADGVGVGVADGLDNAGFDVSYFKGGEASDKRDKTGTLEFANKRAAGWWQLRDALNPANQPVLELPHHEMLISDLCSGKYKFVGRDKILIEPKVEVKKRLGRSPDHGDAVMMGCFRERKRRMRRMVYAGRAR